MMKVSARMTTGRRVRLLIKDLGLRRYKIQRSGGHYWAKAAKVTLLGRAHFLRVDQALVDIYGERVLRSELRRFFKEMGIDLRSVRGLIAAVG